eukprot:TRINITY_DN22874_c0_g1_i2.p1 TRINITY_DN22874_c0_g1~~TRINITY_DN22874_c0_g1_i2.p1  ORF type:complete len:312 (+),score=71.23 TRINITY_DN22874_c0_g1_i2:59-937(+)
MCIRDRQTTENRPEEGIRMLRPQIKNSKRNEQPILLEACSSPVLCNDVIIHRSSIKLERLDTNLYDLRFVYSSYDKATITVFYMVEEVIDRSSRVTQFFSEIFPTISQAKSFKLNEGLDVTFPPRMFLLDFSRLKPGEFTFQPGDNRYGLVLKCELWQAHHAQEVVVKTDEKEYYTKELYIFMNFFIRDDEIQVEIVRQKIDLDKSSFQVEEIFGINNAVLNKHAPEEAKNEIEKECVVCYSEKIDSVIMPCRHFVLCSTCATNVKENSRKCPLCRKEVKGMVKIKLKDTAF